MLSLLLCLTSSRRKRITRLEPVLLGPQKLETKTTETFKNLDAAKDYFDLLFDGSGVSREKFCAIIKGVLIGSIKSPSPVQKYQWTREKINGGYSLEYFSFSGIITRGTDGESFTIKYARMLFSGIICGRYKEKVGRKVSVKLTSPTVSEMEALKPKLLSIKQKTFADFEKSLASYF